MPSAVLCRAVGLQFGLQTLYPAHVCFSGFSVPQGRSPEVHRSIVIPRWSTIGEGRIAKGHGRYRCPRLSLQRHCSGAVHVRFRTLFGLERLDQLRRLVTPSGRCCPSAKTGLEGTLNPRTGETAAASPPSSAGSSPLGGFGSRTR